MPLEPGLHLGMRVRAVVVHAPGEGRAPGTPGRAGAGISETPDAGGARNTGRRPGPARRPERQTGSSCHCACSRGSSCRSGPSSSAGPAACGPSAWIWLFSSTHSTSACCGGFRYSPTTSVSFSRNLGSRDSLKRLAPVRLQIVAAPDVVDRGLADALALPPSSGNSSASSPWAWCAASPRRWRDLLCSIGGLASATGRDSHRLFKPLLSEPRRHKITVLRLVSNSRAIALSDWPLAAASTMRPRSATCCGVPCAASHRWICSRSLALNRAGLRA